MNMDKFADKIRTAGRGPLAASDVKILQVNLGYRCNMACRHCHASAGPGRAEAMNGEIVDAVLGALRKNPIGALDITGGAPELNPHFRSLVSETRKTGKRVMVRTNLTVFFEEGMADLPEFYWNEGVELIASLPCYLENNVNAIRGGGAYRKSIEALRRLNELGFGNGSSERPLSLVYNPGGPFLPPEQRLLEADYKRELKNRFGVSFTRLYAFTNMPIGRFRDFLIQSGSFEKYQGMLASSFNPCVLDNVMCRSLVSVGWDGALYDCDFNQILGIPLDPDAPRHIKDFDHAGLSRRKISTGDHCFGCTAGQGST
ncbi:MAG TPA: arsenosugar biosynthesis radical SAM (seleno)protein ArsS [Nitrospirota bacterium]